MAPPTPAVIAKEFVKQYYSILVNDRAKLHRFYCDESYTMRGEDTQDAELVSGVDGIKRLIDSSAPISKVDYTNVDVQMSSNSGVVLLVTGSVLLASGWRRFVQNFFLCPQNKSKANYFVINDTFRLLAPAPLSGSLDQNSVSAPVKTQPVRAQPPAAVPAAAEVAAPPKTQPQAPEAAPPAAEAPSADADAGAEEPGTASNLTWAQRAAKNARRSAPPAPKEIPAPEGGAGSSDAATASAGASGAAQSSAPVEEKDSHAIFVKGLVPEVTENDLRVLFQQFGEVTHVNFRENRGFAFIEFKEPQAASKSLEKNGELQLKDTVLALEPRHPKPAGPGAGKGRGGRGRGKGGRGGDGTDRGGRGKSGRGGRGRRTPTASA